jgi:hypothetical protein
MSGRLKLFLFLFVALASSLQLFARPIKEEKACAIATRFYYMKKLGDDIKKVKSLEGLDLVYSPQHGDKVSLTAPEYYVFAPSNRKGFVIVAGDDAVEQLIVGYSLEAPISSSLSSSLLGYLNCYAGYIDALRHGKATPKAKRSTTPVVPLLTTQWGQRAPYNYFCPVLNERKLITGCVTTAVAQIMKYHAWPAKGEGVCRAEVQNIDITYTTITLGEEYDWQKMKDRYPYSKKMRITDVARLMRDVGHAVGVMYTPVLTSAKSAGVPKALVEHFAYSPEMRHVHRSHYTDEEWNRLMVDELAAHRPIYYSTRSTRHDGHAFVVCGIDEQGLYYTNWGWGGQCDGYFDFDCVTSSNAAYNYVQSAIIGIEPMR